MRLIIARCEVRYSGRLDAMLPEAIRLLVIKSDGSVYNTHPADGSSAAGEGEGGQAIGAYSAEADARDPEPYVLDSTSTDYPPHIATLYLQLPHLDPRVAGLARQVTTSRTSTSRPQARTPGRPPRARTSRPTTWAQLRSLARSRPRRRRPHRRALPRPTTPSRRRSRSSRVSSHLAGPSASHSSCAATDGCPRRPSTSRQTKGAGFLPCSLF